LCFGILSAFPAFETYVQEINDLLFRHFVPASADTIQTYLEKFAKNASELSVVGLLISLASAVLLIYIMEDVLNAIWRVERSRHRRGVSAFILYWGVLTMLP